MTGVHIVLGAVACFALWRLWRSVTRATTPLAALIVSGGFLLRAFAGQALFWISWLNLPIARSLHAGEGYWFFAIDSPGYMTYAKLIVQGHPDPVYPSRVFVHILAAFIFAFGRFTSVAILLNCATYLAASALILFIAREAKAPALVALAAIAFAPGTVLWSLQPLKDSLFMFVFAAMVAACSVWQEAATARQRVAAAVAMLLFIYAIAGLRWYFAIFIWGCWLIFAVLVALTAPRKGWLLLGSIALSALLAVSIRYGAEYDLPQFPSFRNPEPVARLERTRRGFERIPGATTITPGRARSQPQRQPPVPAQVPVPVPPPVLSPVPAPTPVPVPVPASPKHPQHSVVPAPSSPPSTARRIVATAMVTFLPRTIVELFGLAHVAGGRGLWLFVEGDTLAFDAVLIFAIVYGIRSRRRITPLSIMLLLLFFLTAIPVIYVVNNFGTLFRLREMLYLLAAFLPLTLGRPRQ